MINYSELMSSFNKRRQNASSKELPRGETPDERYRATYKCNACEGTGPYGGPCNLCVEARERNEKRIREVYDVQKAFDRAKPGDWWEVRPGETLQDVAPRFERLRAEYNEQARLKAAKERAAPPPHTGVRVDKGGIHTEGGYMNAWEARMLAKWLVQAAEQFERGEY